MVDFGLCRTNLCLRTLLMMSGGVILFEHFSNHGSSCPSTLMALIHNHPSSLLTPRRPTVTDVATHCSPIKYSEGPWVPFGHATKVKYIDLKPSRHLLETGGTLSFRTTEGSRMPFMFCRTPCFSLPLVFVPFSQTCTFLGRATDPNAPISWDSFDPSVPSHQPVAVPVLHNRS